MISAWYDAQCMPNAWGSETEVGSFNIITFYCSRMIFFLFENIYYY